MKKSDLKPGFHIFGNKGNVWLDECHIAQSGFFSETLCGVPMLSNNHAALSGHETIGCKKCQQLYAFHQFAESVNSKVEKRRAKKIFVIDESKSHGWSSGKDGVRSNFNNCEEVEVIMHEISVYACSYFCIEMPDDTLKFSFETGISWHSQANAIERFKQTFSI